MTLLIEKEEIVNMKKVKDTFIVRTLSDDLTDFLKDIGIASIPILKEFILIKFFGRGYLAYKTFKTLKEDTELINDLRVKLKEFVQKYKNELRKAANYIKRKKVNSITDIIEI